MNSIIAFIFIKRYIVGVRNFFYLLLTFKLIKYLKTEKDIIQKLSKYKDSKVLLLSGGNSLNEYWDKVKLYDYIALNSFNSFDVLSDNKKEEIKDKLLIYYQAPYHKPLNMKCFNDGIDRVIKYFNNYCLVIHNKNGEKKTIYYSDKNINFRSFANLNLLGFRFVHSSGFFVLLNILISSGYKKIDILGVDLDFQKTNTYRTLDDLIVSNLINAELFLTIKMFKKSISKNKKVLITNLNPNSFYNLV